MLIVIALGGNALLKRGEAQEAKLQLENVKTTAKAIAEIAKHHKLIICHGNGPQVGLLALQNLAYTKISPYPLDVLGAETQGMIGYMIQKELKNLMPEREIVTLLTQVLVDKNDPAFQNPSKPIGPVYSEEEAKEIAEKFAFTIAPDGKHFRRVVASPIPQKIVELNTIKSLLKLESIIICGGGGGIPVVKNHDETLTGVEVVIDKDLTAALIAKEVGADVLMVLTDVNAVAENFGRETEKRIKAISPRLLKQMQFPAGSMGPKIAAASKFVENGGKFATIGNLFEISEMLRDEAGTKISQSVEKVLYY